MKIDPPLGLPLPKMFRIPHKRSEPKRHGSDMPQFDYDDPYVIPTHVIGTNNSALTMSSEDGPTMAEVSNDNVPSPALDESTPRGSGMFALIQSLTMAVVPAL